MSEVRDQLSEGRELRWLSVNRSWLKVAQRSFQRDAAVTQREDARPGFQTNGRDARAPRSSDAPCSLFPSSIFHLPAPCSPSGRTRRDEFLAQHFSLHRGFHGFQRVGFSSQLSQPRRCSGPSRKRASSLNISTACFSFSLRQLLL